jgi:hypothetical protein
MNAESRHPGDSEVASQCQFDEVVRSVLEALRPQARGVEIDLVGDLPGVRVSGMLRPALSALLGEAIRYARGTEGRRLSLEAVCHPELVQLNLRHEPSERDDAPDTTPERAQLRLKALEIAHDAIECAGGRLIHHVHPASPPTYTLEMPVLESDSRSALTW